ncbi:MAG TPA: DUF4340 domain-containing protein [Terriglobia bacterium]|nr:DUF4340 domain-containing protein [Terriglobia bacterium]
MKGKYLNTLIALAVLAALWGGSTYYNRRKQKIETVSTPAKVDKLLPLTEAQVQSFTLKPHDGAPVTCVRGEGKGAGWAIVQPEKLPADQSVINSFLSTLTSATVDQEVSAKPADLKPFGLDTPQETVEISASTRPEKYTLLLGDDTPTSDGVYAQLAGNPRVVTLASYLKTSLDKKLFDLRDKRAITLDTDQLKQIEVISKTSRYTLVKNPEGVWDLVMPPPVRADHYTVDGLVSGLQNLSMRSVVLEKRADLAKYGLTSPSLTLKLTGPSATETLTFGSKEEKGANYYAMNSSLDPVFTLDASAISQFEKQPADLRDKDLFSFSQFDAKRVDIQTPSGHRTFEMQGDKWKQTAPSAKDEPRPKMDDLLSALRDLRAESFPKDVSLQAAGLTKPAYHFEVQFGQKKQTEVVEAAATKDHIYARRSTDTLPSELSKGALDSIDKALKSLPQ